MRVLGWDIGGANLKVSDGAARSIERPFALWKSPEMLADVLKEMSELFEASDAWAVTMTGELADCFRTKREGVRRILESVRKAAAGASVGVWTTSGEFVSVNEAIEWPRLTAAANWLALATWVGRMIPKGNGLLIDIGSTTTDLIRLKDGFPDPDGRTDVQRMVQGELIYTGVRRTPVAAISRAVMLRGIRCPLAAELFATSLDLYLLTKRIEESEERDTVNGEPSTIDAAFDRLARMVCCDREEIAFEDVEGIASQLAISHTSQISEAVQWMVDRMDGQCQGVVLSGSGEFLARDVVKLVKGLKSAEIYSLGQILGGQHATAACAFALARLAGERELSPQS